MSYARCINRTNLSRLKWVFRFIFMDWMLSNRLAMFKCDVILHTLVIESWFNSALPATEIQISSIEAIDQRVRFQFETFQLFAHLLTSLQTIWNRKKVQKNSSDDDVNRWTNTKHFKFHRIAWIQRVWMCDTNKYAQSHAFAIDLIIVQQVLFAMYLKFTAKIKTFTFSIKFNVKSSCRTLLLREIERNTRWKKNGKSFVVFFVCMVSAVQKHKRIVDLQN